MTTPTQAREPEMGLTFEKVWAMFQESDRRMQKMKEDTDEYLRKLSGEADRRMQKLSEETDRKMQETDRKMQETARQIKETNRQIGKLGNRFGELAEHLIAPSIVQKFNALGFHFDDISALRQVIEDESSGQKIAEFDILLENGEFIIGVEVKSKPSYDDVDDHAQRLKILRLNKDRKGDKRKIYGALAGAIMPDTVRTAALKAGFYVITQTGDTVKIDVPEGFIPKAW
ncbi:MAG: hypothetical protein LBQ42_08000 [Synergistaceae bacterium]|jgi:hypothetical protein|nr:hypothetical protein [Synergistaceae bacterium]